jgi:hypothetical protein
MNQQAGLVTDVNLDLHRYSYNRDQDTKSITSTPSRISRFTYSGKKNNKFTFLMRY